PRRPMKANEPPIGWLILSGLTEQAFLEVLTIAIGRALFRRLERRRGLRGEDVLDPSLAGPAAARGVGMLLHPVDGGKPVRGDRILDGAEIDRLAEADLPGAPGLFGTDRVGRDLCGLRVHLRHRLGLPIDAGIVPGSGLAELAPHRIVERLLDL